MDLTFTDEQDMLRSTARDLLRARAGIAGVRAVRTAGGHSEKLWREITELGWTGLAVPERHDGLGAGFLESCLVLEELGAALVPTPFLVTTACAAPAVARFGTEQQLAAWLPSIAAGRIVTVATRTTVTASRTARGYSLAGSATFVPFAASADAYVLTARTDAGPTVFLIGPEQAARIKSTPLQVLGPTPRSRVHLDEITVSEADVLGSEGAGGEVARAAELFGGAAACAEMAGGARRVLELTLDYARERTQFGRPIGAFQAVQHSCADMAADVLGTQLLGYEAIWRLAQAPDTGAVPDDAALTVYCAKAWASDAYQRVCARAHQVHGAIGFTSEHDLHLYLEHAMSAAQAFGDAEQHLSRVADTLGLPRQHPQPH